MKFERLPSPGEYALYISLGTPRVQLGDLTRTVLNGLMMSDSETVLGWMRHYDKTIICVGGSAGSANLIRTSDKKAKAYYPISTTKMIRPIDFISELPKGETGTIYINERSTTIEALLITCLHMLNELLWRRYEKADSVPYAEVLRDVANRGFSVKAASEHVIIGMEGDPDTFVRRYGSGTNGNVPRIMGSVNLLGQSDRGAPQALPVIFSTPRHKVVGGGSEGGKVGELFVANMITLAKEVHMGHAFLFALTELMGNSLGSKNTTHLLINNDTGPRAAATLALLAKERSLTVDETAQKLHTGQIHLSKIIRAYQARDKANKPLSQEANDVLENNPYDIFSVLSVEANRCLTVAGFNIQIVPESSMNGGSAVVNPLWGGTGFDFGVSRGGIVVFREKGELTPYGKLARALMNLGSSKKSETNRLLVLVDSTPKSKQTIEALQDLQEGSTNYRSLVGTGVAIDRQTATGSNNLALTLREVLEMVEGKIPLKDLHLAIQYLVLTRPIIIKNGAKRIVGGTTNFGYKDNRALTEDLVSCHTERLDLFTKAQEAIVRLGKKASDVTVLDPGQLMKNTKEIPQADPGKIVSSMDKMRLIPRRSDGFNKLYNKLERHNVNEPMEFILKALLDGEKSAGAILKKAREKYPKIPEMPGMDFTVQNEILTLVLKQGYRDTEAMEMTMRYISGLERLALRRNYFYDRLNYLLRFEKTIESVSKTDMEYIENSILFCLKRLGYE